ncbi:MAG: hypothetical protein GC159_20095 [Phycisphaera sp.]|nr:hypothetical protein [Phycisphaera sp.]
MSDDDLLPVEFECVYCSTRHRVAGQYAGRRIHCKSCNEIIRVPGGSLDLAPPPTTDPRDVDIDTLFGDSP